MEGFFQRVLPETGDYVVLAIRPGDGKGRAFDINGIRNQAALSGAVRKLSTKPLNLFVAIGSYDDHRKNPRAKRALFLDLDAKHFAPEGTDDTDVVALAPYKALAARELTIFHRATGFPMPAIIVDSGGGLHCYWPFDRDIDVREWRVLAEALKAKCKEAGFKADHPITADTGRVLRIPGTVNQKYATPVPCRQLRDTGATFDPVALLEQLGGPASFEDTFVGVSQIIPAGTNDDLAGGLPELVPPTPEEVREMLRCIQIQPGGGKWIVVMSAVHDWSSGSEDGFEIAHEWSSTQPKYVSEQDVRHRWRSLGKGGGIDRRPVTIGTLIKMAKDGGWVRAEPEDGEPDPVIIDEPAVVEDVSPELAAMRGFGGEQSFSEKVGTSVASTVGATPAAGGGGARSRIASNLGLSKSKQKEVHANVRNAAVAIRNFFSGSIWYDKFTTNMMTTIPLPHDKGQPTAPRKWSDVDDISVQIFLQEQAIPKLGKDAVRDAVAMIANEDVRDTVADWLRSLEWDGKRRLSQLMELGFGTPKHRYYIRAGRNWIISMVARAIRPGCQVDTCTVLEGAQGALKSSALRIIGGELYNELTADPMSKDFEQQLRGVWLGEFAELATVRRPDDIQRLKQFLTNRNDHYRPSYGRYFIDDPRKVVFVGTTNDDTWIADQTGARRFIPVAVGSINLQWLMDNRDQLFAEATALYLSKRTWWHFPRRATMLMQSARTQVDPWFDDIHHYMLAQKAGFNVTSREIMARVLGMPAQQQTQGVSIRVGLVLRKLGCHMNRQRVGGVVTRAWVWRGPPT